MRERCILLAAALVWSVAAAFGQFNCPTVTAPTLSATAVCPGDAVTLTVSPGSNLAPSPGQFVEWHLGTDPNFTPTPSTRVGTANISGSGGGAPCSPVAPFIIGVNINACDAPGFPNGSENDEFVVLFSGSGFSASGLSVGVANTGGGSVSDPGSAACPFLPSPVLPVTGSCVVLGGPNTVVPANAFVIVFTSSQAQFPLDVTPLCLSGRPIYVFQNSCSRVLMQNGRVEGAFNNSSGSYTVNFGCSVSTYAYSGAPSNGNTLSVLYSPLLNTFFQSPCGSLPPTIPVPPNIPVQYTIDPFTYTTSAADCGTRYFKATVRGPAVPATCPNPPSTGSVTLQVECPAADLSGSQTVCQGANLAPINIAVGQGGGNYRVDYTINGVAQPSLVGPGPTIVVPFSAVAPGNYVIALTGVRGSRCVGTASGVYTVTISTSTPVPLTSATICALDQPYNLNQLLPTTPIAGMWSGGTGVSGSTFNAGPGASGPYSVTYTPATGIGACLSPNTTTITVQPASSFALLAAAPVCAGATVNLSSLLPSGAPTGGMWSVTPAASISGSILTIPATGAAPSYTVTYTPSGGACASPASTTVSVQPNTSITLATPPAVCAGATLDLSSLLPSGAPMGGMWSVTPAASISGSILTIPAMGAASSYTVTYTPSGGACANPGSTTVSVQPRTSVTLATPPAVCAGAMIDLSSLLPSGAPTGMWSVTPAASISGSILTIPATGAASSYTVTYTPSGGACASPGSTTVSVQPNTSITLATPPAVCAGATLDLSSLLPSGAPAGSWSVTPAASISGSILTIPATGAAPSYTVTYTPSGGACASPGSTTVSVQPATSVTLATPPAVCAGATLDLSSLLPSGAPTGNWSVTPAASISGSILTIPATGAASSYTVTYTPTGSACASPASTTVSVQPNTSVTLATPPAVCAGATLDLSSLLPSGAPAGMWSVTPAASISGSILTIPATGAASSYTVTYTPTSGACANPGSTTVSVQPATSVTLATPPAVCAGANLDLSSLLPSGAPTGNWSVTPAASISGSILTIPATGAASSYTVTYTPTGSACASPASTTVSVQPNTSVTLATPPAVCAGATLDLSSLLPSGAPAGMWSVTPAASISGSILTIPATGAASSYTVTYTPTSGACANPGSTTVSVQPATSVTLATPPAVCAGANLDLSTLLPSGAPAGMWSVTPAASISGSILTIPATGAAPSYTVTYTPSGVACANPGSTTVSVQPATSVTLATPPAVCAGATLDLSSLLPSGAPAGMWSVTPAASISGSILTIPATGAASSYTVTYTPSGGACASPGSTTVSVQPRTSVTLATPPAVCAGATLDLSSLLPSGAPAGMWSVTPAASISGSILTIPATGAASSYTVTYTPTSGACANPGSTTVSVQPRTSITLVTPPAVCTGATLDLSSLLPSGAPAGMWSVTPAASISGSILTIPATGAASSYTVTYTPSGGACANPASTTVSVQPRLPLPINPSPVACVGAPFDLNSLFTATVVPGTWSGPGVTPATGVFTPTSTGTVSISFQPASGQCFSPVVIVAQVQSSAPISIAGATICANTGNFHLDDLLPVGAPTGVWSGQGVNDPFLDTDGRAVGQLVVTYTPDAGCFTAAPVTLTVQATGRPTLVGGTSVCVATATFDLRTLVPAAAGPGSWQGPTGTITGSNFLPAAAGPGTFTLSFTPDAPCLLPATTTVQVLPEGVITIAAQATCTGSAPFDLTTLEPTGFTGGQWSGSARVSGTQLDISTPGNFTLRYQAPAGQCAAPANVAFAITPAVTLQPRDATVCINDGPLALSTLADPAAPGGTWTLNGAPVTVFDPAGRTPGPYVLTYRTGAACTNPGTATITVTAGASATLANGDVCLLANTFDLNSLVIAGGPGTWSHPNVSGSTLDLAAVGPGPVTVTYTPAGGCASPATTTVTVGAPDPVAVNDGQICITELPFDLAALERAPNQGGAWTGPEVMGSVYAPASPQFGTYTFTYAPLDAVARCLSPGTATLDVANGQPVRLRDTSICAGETLDLRLLVPTGAPAGTWTPAPGLTGTAYTPPAGTSSVRLTYTPNAPGACVTAGTATVSVRAAGTPLSFAPVTLCTTDAPLALMTVPTGGAPGGTWRNAAGVVAQTIDPSALGAGNYTYTYTGTAAQCSPVGTLAVAVTAALTPALGSGRACQQNTSFDLSTLLDPLYPSGVWSLNGTALTTLVPSDYPVGTLTLTFQSDEDCVNAATTTVELTAPAPVQLRGGQRYCANSGSYDLSGLLPAGVSGGVWGGDADAATGTFATDGRSPGAYTITYSASGNCRLPGQTQVFVDAGGAAEPGDTSVCANGAAFALTLLGDPVITDGAWTDARGAAATQVDPAALGAGTFVYTFTPTGTCFASGTAEVVVRPLGRPTIADRTVCFGGPAIQLSDWDDPAFAGGDWSGPGVTNNTYTPQALGLAVLSYEPPAATCGETVTVRVTVSPGSPATLRPRDFCVDEPPTPLASIGDPAFPNGSWSGDGVRGALFDPALAGVGPATLTFTPTAGCAGPTSVTFEVYLTGSPTLVSAQRCDAAGAFELATLIAAGNDVGQWSGTGVTADRTRFDPAVAGVGMHTLTFTPAGGCGDPVTTTVTVDAATAITLGVGEVCEGTSAIAIAVLLPQNPGPGTWSGLDLVGDSLRTAGLPPGDYPVVFTPDPSAQPCALPGMGLVRVTPGGRAAVDDQRLCVVSPSVTLTTLEPTGFGGGAWTLSGTRVTTFDAGALGVGSYVLRYDPPGDCTPAVDVTFDVTNSVTATVAPLSRCLVGPPINLTALAPAAAPGGSWIAADGSTVTSVNPAQLGAGTYRFRYEAPAGSCLANAPELVLNVSEPVAVALPVDSVCIANGAVQLTSLLVPSGATGTWAGPGVRPDGLLTPSDGDGVTRVTFVPSGGCYTAADYSFELVAVAPLVVGTPRYTCAPDGLTYDASLDLTFGQNNGRIVSTLGTIAGSVLTIAGLASGASASGVVDDATSCASPVTVTLEHTCGSTPACTTDAGTLSGGPYVVCTGEQVVFPAVTGAVLDGDDVLIYVLDADQDPTNGVLATAASPLFDEPAGANGRLLYVYARAGNGDGSGGIATDDDCADASTSVRVRWITALVAASSNVVCEPDNAAFRVTIQLEGGERPYAASGTTGGRFSADGATFISDLIPSGGTSDIRLASAGGRCNEVVVAQTRDCSPACDLPDPGSFAASPAFLCGGGTSRVGYKDDAELGPDDLQEFRVYADAARTMLLGRFASLPIDFTTLGTGTTVYVTSYAGRDDGSGGIDASCAAESTPKAVELREAIVSRFDTIVCPIEPFVYLGLRFDVDRPSATFIWEGVDGACDTTLLIRVTFSEGGQLFERGDTLCASETIRIGGRLFDASNPRASFSVGQGACEDRYEVDLVFLPEPTALINQTLCRGDVIVIGNQTFDESRPTGTATVQAANGCDSVVTVRLAFEDRPVVTLTGDPTFCNPDAVAFTLNNASDRAVSGTVTLNDGTTSTLTLAPGSNPVSYPAVRDFTFRIEGLQATTGSCVDPDNSSLAYRPRVSLLAPSIDEPLSGGFRSCEGSAVPSIGVAPTGGVGPFSYLWSRGDTTQSIRDVGLGDYTVTVTDRLGCTAETAVSVTEADTLSYTVTTVDPTCAGGLGSLSISLDELPPGVRYRFDLPGVRPLVTPDLAFDSVRAGRYVFQLIQDNGCDQSTFITLAEPELINWIKPDSIEVRLGDSIQLRVRVEPEQRVLWTPSAILSCDTCALTMAGPLADTEVTVAVTDASGCVSVDRVQLVLLPAIDIFIPSAFSPNSDGVNDELLPLVGPEVARVLGFQVFDRWGEAVHRAFDFAPGDPRAAWDGRFKGREMDPAVFVVYTEVELVTGERRAATGDVTLLR